MKLQELNESITVTADDVRRELAILAHDEETRWDFSGDYDMDKLVRAINDELWPTRPSYDSSDSEFGSRQQGMRQHIQQAWDSLRGDEEGDIPPTVREILFDLNNTIGMDAFEK